MRDLARRTSRARCTSRIVLIAAIAIMATGAGASAQSGGGCRLAGTVTFGPGLTYVPQTTAFGINANLSLCQSVPAGPASGTVSIGRVWTDPATGFQWQEPAGTLEGGCGAALTEGISIIRWADGTVTVLEISTTSASGQIVLEGESIPSVTLTALNAAPGQAETLTLSTNRYPAGRTVGQLDVIGPTNAILLCATSGLPSVTIDGASSLFES